MSHLFERKIWGSNTGCMALEFILYTTTSNIYSLQTHDHVGLGEYEKIWASLKKRNETSPIIPSLKY